MPERDVTRLLRRWIALVAGLAALYACGRNGPLAAPPLDPHQLAAWVGQRQTPEVVVAVGRLLGLAAGTYLLVLLSVALFAHLTGRARVRRMATRLVPAGLRSILALTTATVALGVTTGLAGTAAANPLVVPAGHRRVAPPPADTDQGPPTTASPSSPPLLRRVPSTPPGAPLLRRVPPTTIVPATTVPTTTVPATTVPATTVPTARTSTTTHPTTTVPTTTVPTAPDPTAPPGPTGSSIPTHVPPSHPTAGRVPTPWPTTPPHSGIAVPGRTTTGRPSPTHRLRSSGARPQPPGPVRYVVQPGDSFWSIATTQVKGAGPDPDTGRVASYWWMLVQTNRPDLPVPGNPDLLFPGDTVRLPPLPGSGA